MKTTEGEEHAEQSGWQKQKVMEEGGGGATPFSTKRGETSREVAVAPYAWFSVRLSSRGPTRPPGCQWNVEPSTAGTLSPCMLAGPVSAGSLSMQARRLVGGLRALRSSQ